MPWLCSHQARNAHLPPDHPSRIGASTRAGSAEKALTKLRHDGLIHSVIGKGYYVSGT
jgi:hypothetical protein